MRLGIAKFPFVRLRESGCNSKSPLVPKKSRKARKQTNLRTPHGEGPRLESERRPQSVAVSEAQPKRRVERAETPRVTPKAVERAVANASSVDDTDRESPLPARKAPKSNRTLYIGLVAIALAGGSFWAWRQSSATPAPSPSAMPTKPSPPTSTGGRVLAPPPAEQGVEPEHKPATATPPSASAMASAAATAVASAVPSSAPSAAAPPPVLPRAPTPEDKPVAPKPKAPKPTAADEIY